MDSGLPLTKTSLGRGPGGGKGRGGGEGRGEWRGGKERGGKHTYL